MDATPQTMTQPVVGTLATTAVAALPLPPQLMGYIPVRLRSSTQPVWYLTEAATASATPAGTAPTQPPPNLCHTPGYHIRLCSRFYRALVVVHGTIVHMLSPLLRNMLQRCPPRVQETTNAPTSTSRPSYYQRIPQRAKHACRHTTQQQTYTQSTTAGAPGNRKQACMHQLHQPHQPHQHQLNEPSDAAIWAMLCITISTRAHPRIWHATEGSHTRLHAPCLRGPLSAAGKPQTSKPFKHPSTSHSTVTGGIASSITSIISPRAASSSTHCTTRPTGARHISLNIVHSTVCIPPAGNQASGTHWIVSPVMLGLVQ